ncbi:MAG: BatD family protein, partial [Roseibium sp.]|uniref:BatD family protein n=1 Tax=Roseibium sp. TaxID=1936156 RepID=UPI0026396A68
MKRTGIKKALLAAALTLAVSHGALAASLNARINTDKVAVGDQFQLTLSTDGSGAAMPDLAPLQKEFNVLGTSSSMQAQIINGRQSQQQSWIVTLSPKQKGQLTIPELSFDGASSRPLTLSVVDQADLPKSQGVQGVAVKALLQGDHHYLYQEIPLTVRIETSVPLKRAELIAPSDTAFELTPNGDERTSQIMRDGKPVTVIERQYMLRPQKTGELTIAPFVIRGEVKDPNARQSPFDRMGMGRSLFDDFPFKGSAFGGGGFGGSLFDDMFSPGKPFAARSDAIKMSVEGGTATGDEQWFLPAKAVELISSWQPDQPEFKVGEAVTRKVSILALGARPEQLPDLEFTSPDGARIYVDGDTSDEFNTDEGTVGRREIVTSIVPTSGGEVVLPEIALKWWDTEAGEERTATIPAEAIQVEGPVTVSTVAPPAAAEQTPLPDTNGNPVLSQEWVYAGGGIAVTLALALGTALAVRRRHAPVPVRNEKSGKGERPNRRPQKEAERLLAAL